jgi:hypothetical protein
METCPGMGSMKKSRNTSLLGSLTDGAIVCGIANALA